MRGDIQTVLIISCIDTWKFTPYLANISLEYNRCDFTFLWKSILHCWSIPVAFNCCHLLPETFPNLFLFDGAITMQTSFLISYLLCLYWHSFAYILLLVLVWDSSNRFQVLEISIFSFSHTGAVKNTHISPDLIQQGQCRFWDIAFCWKFTLSKIHFIFSFRGSL